MDENRVASAPTVSLDYDMSRCPGGLTLNLLPRGGVLVRGRYDGDPGYVAWAMLPERDKERERALGLRIG